MFLPFLLGQLAFGTPLTYPSLGFIRGFSITAVSIEGRAKSCLSQPGTCKSRIPGLRFSLSEAGDLVFAIVEVGKFPVFTHPIEAGSEWGAHNLSQQESEPWGISSSCEKGFLTARSALRFGTPRTKRALGFCHTHASGPNVPEDGWFDLDQAEAVVPSFRAFPCLRSRQRSLAGTCDCRRVYNSQFSDYLRAH